MPAALMLLGGCVAVPRASAPSQSPPPAARPSAPLGAPEFTLQGVRTQGGLMLGTAPAGAVAVTLNGASVPLFAGGRFLFGLDRDAPAAMRLEARFADGSSHAETVAVRPRQWDIQSLPTLRRGTTPSADFTRRRNAELAQIGAARARNSISDGWRQSFAWPVTGRISGVFGSQRIYAGEPGAYHSGVDVARPTGTPVAAPADGVVVLAAAAPFTLEGNLLMIDHGAGLNSAFLHLSRIDVRVGDRVTRGQTVGAIGATGRVTGPHLHWSLRWRDARLDPELVVPPMVAPAK